jgi:hypothetical protein
METRFETEMIHTSYGTMYSDRCNILPQFAGYIYTLEMAAVCSS